MKVIRYNPSYHVFRKDSKDRACFYLLCTEQEVREFFYADLPEPYQESFDNILEKEWLCMPNQKEELYSIIIDANMKDCILVGWVFLSTAMNNTKQDFLPVTNPPLSNPLDGIDILSPLEISNIEVSHLNKDMAFWDGQITTQKEFYDR